MSDRRVRDASPRPRAVRGALRGAIAGVILIGVIAAANAQVGIGGGAAGATAIDLRDADAAVEIARFAGADGDYALSTFSARPEGRVCVTLQRVGEPDRTYICTADGFAMGAVGAPQGRVVFGITSAEVAQVEIVDEGRSRSVSLATQEVSARGRQALGLSYVPRYFVGETTGGKLAVVARSATGRRAAGGALDAVTWAGRSGAG